MSRMPLDIYDDMPKAMKRYISNYGWHFNKEACEYAVSLIRKKDGQKVSFLDKKEVESLLKKHSVTLENDTLYDGTFVYHMGLADYFGSSIKDE